MLGLLVTLARDHGKTILVSTHVLRDVQSICDRLVLLVRGRVQLAGSIAELTSLADHDLRLQGSGQLAELADRLTRLGIPARLAETGQGVVLHAAESAAIVAAASHALPGGAWVTWQRPLGTYAAACERSGDAARYVAYGDVDSRYGV